MQIRQNKIRICRGLFLAIPDLKLKNVNETSIKNPSYSGDQLIPREARFINLSRGDRARIAKGRVSAEVTCLSAYFSRR